MKNTIIKKYGKIAVALIIVVVVLVSCSSSKKDVAMEFAEAMISDFDAKKAVDLMSEDHKDKLMAKMDAATEKILISKVQDQLERMAGEYEDKYGERWKISIEYIDSYGVDEDIVAVELAVTIKGTGGFLGLSDKEDKMDMTVTLIKESGKWKVCEWDSSSGYR